MPIKFGTSGWRAVIGEEFTFKNVEAVTEAVCRYLKDVGKGGGGIIVGHDARFMGERFAGLAAGIAARKGFKVLLCGGPAPTPAIAHAIRKTGATGGINFTASHNPPEYQGIKFSTSDGAPALPEITERLEKLIAAGATSESQDGGSIEEFDPRPGYLADLESKIRFEVMERASGKYAYDPLWGAGRGYLDNLLRAHGLEVQTLRDWRDVTFGGMSPEPGERQMAELSAKVLSGGLTLGLSTDGDADRFGVVDSDGTLVSPNVLIAILTDYLAESRGWTDGVARSVATSQLVDRVAESRGLKVYETPVGFKFIGELINEDRIVLGGEESAGLSIKGHYPEKDGILACLLAAEAVAARGKSLAEQHRELVDRLGNVESARIGVRLTDEVAASLKTRLASDPSEIGGRKVAGVNRVDGVKFLFEDGTWMLMRPSGTEPVVRIYAESASRADLEVLLEQGRKFLLG